MPPVQVDSCTDQREDLTAGWHWYEYVFGIPLGMLGFYDPGRTVDWGRGLEIKSVQYTSGTV